MKTRRPSVTKTVVICLALGAVFVAAGVQAESSTYRCSDCHNMKTLDVTRFCYVPLSTRETDTTSQPLVVAGHVHHWIFTGGTNSYGINGWLGFTLSC